MHFPIQGNNLKFSKPRISHFDENTNFWVHMIKALPILMQTTKVFTKRKNGCRLSHFNCQILVFGKSTAFVNC